jgi:hypothetical protein
MSDEMKTIFTPDQLAKQAEGNATALALATIAYLQDHHLDIDEYWASVGRRFAPGWVGLQGQTMKDFAQEAALNMVSVGGTLRSLSGDDFEAEAVILGWPSDEDCTFFALDYADIDPFWNIFQPIAESLGVHYAWKRQGDEVTLIFSRRS